MFRALASFAKWVGGEGQPVKANYFIGGLVEE